MKTNVKKRAITGVFLFLLFVSVNGVLAGNGPCFSGTSSGSTGQCNSIGNTAVQRQVMSYFSSRGMTVMYMRQTYDGTNSVIVTTSGGQQIMVYMSEEEIIIGTLNLPN